MNKGLEKIKERLATVEPGTIRYEALEAAKRFKSSWVELGRVLWPISREKKFREWGYLTFEAYCTKEIRIRPATAKKLLHSYYFLEKEEPAVLKQMMSGSGSAGGIPQMEAVNLLRVLRNRRELPEENYRRFRSQLLEKGRELPEVRREIRLMLQPVESDPAAARSQRREKTLRRMVITLKAMQQELADGNWVPKKLILEVEGLSKKLEAALKEG